MQGLGTQAVTFACSCILTAAIYTDLTRRIVPNGLVVAGILGGLIYHSLAAASPLQGFAMAAAGLLAGGLLLLLPYLFSWTGAGDVKLLAAVGSWLGPVPIVKVFVCTTLVGGVMAALVTIRYGKAFRRTCVPGGAAAVGRRSTSTVPGLPYALAMGGGYLLFLAWENFR